MATTEPTTLANSVLPGAGYVHLNQPVTVPCIITLSPDTSFEERVPLYKCTDDDGPFVAWLGVDNPNGRPLVVQLKRAHSAGSPVRVETVAAAGPADEATTTVRLPLNWQPPEGAQRDRINAHLAEMAAMPPMPEHRLVDLRTAAVMEVRQFGWQTLAECVAEIDRLRLEVTGMQARFVEYVRGDARPTPVVFNVRDTGEVKRMLMQIKPKGESND